jgi:hypothetical protein
LIVGFSGCGQGTPAAQDVPVETSMKQALDGLAEGKGDLSSFRVTYDDLHPLHGGLTLCIFGSGKVEQTAKPQAVGDPHNVPRDQVLELINLLRKHEAWTQRTPEREPKPDESRSRLTVRVGKTETRIWEWFNDMPRTQRLVIIRDAMKRMAWTPPQK